MSLNTVVLATSAYTSVLHGRFDQMAETAYLMMKREFEYEVNMLIISNTRLRIIILMLFRYSQFVSVRWSFMIALFCFLGMITSRILIEFDLIGEEENNGTKRT
jgi:hypothetical protein